MTKATIARVERFYIRHYRDNGSTVAYCEWIDSKGQRSRTEGQPRGIAGAGGPGTICAFGYHFGAHMSALAARADREGISIETETW